jgi:hypothetical protein
MGQSPRVQSAFHGIFANSDAFSKMGWSFKQTPEQKARAKVLWANDQAQGRLTGVPGGGPAGSFIGGSPSGAVGPKSFMTSGRKY